MQEKIELVLATREDAELIHQMKYEAFLPLYEKYHDEISPVNESIKKVIWKISGPHSEYYLIQVNGENAGAVCVARKRRRNADGEWEYFQGVNYISPIFILPGFQNRGIGQSVIFKLFELYPDTITWKLDTIKQEDRNCHLYEKCGFIRIGEELLVNDIASLVDYEKSNLSIRRFDDSDATAVRELLTRNFIEVNSKDYGIESMRKLAEHHDTEWVKNVAKNAHMYVFEWKNKIVGVGSIASFWGSETESILLTVFVLPELHGNGIGGTIIQTLEADELFTRASRIEIPASVTGTEFYRKFGYDFKNGVKELDDEGHYRLEKFREADKV